MTTAVWLECPVCEYRFSVPQEYADKSGKCPKCEGVFQAGDCQLPEKSLIEEQTEPPIPLPAILSDLQPETKTAVKPPSSEDGSLKSAQVGSESTVNEDQTFVAVEKQRTDPNTVLIWVSISCLLAIGLLIGIPALASMMVDPDDSNESNSLVADNSTNGTTNNGTGKKKSAGKNKKGNKKNNKKKKAKADKTVKDFTVEELQSIWSKSHSGIALINAKFGAESRNSHGVVVSNDGRIAVSLSHVVGADSVRVRLALDKYGEKERWSKPMEATMIISSKPALDVGIIQIAATTTPANARTQSIQYNDRGVIPTLSNKNSSEFLRLTKLRPAKPFSSLSEAEQQSLKSMSLTPEGNDYFGIHSAKLNKNGIGAPVFDEQGLWVGMHLNHHSETRNSFLIPPGVIRKVLNDPTAKPVAIKAGPVASVAAADPKKKSSAPAGDSPTFASALDNMSKLKWKFEDPAAYSQFQDFAERWSTVNKEYLTAGFTRKIRIEELKKQMTTEMDNHLFWPNAESAKTVNEAAVMAFRNRDKGWFGAVTVVKPSGLADDVDGEPAVLVRLNGTNEKALLVPGEVEGPFLSGSEWLVFGINQNNTRLNTSDGKCIVIHLAGVKKR